MGLIGVEARVVIWGSRIATSQVFVHPGISLGEMKRVIFYVAY